MRRFGEIPEPGRRYTLRTGAYAILPGRDGLLLTHQSAPEPEYQLPGGGVDPGESPVQALFREVYEETGWRIARPQRLGAYRRFTYMPEYDLWAEKLCLIYMAVPVVRYGDPIEPDHTALWMTPDTAMDYLANSGDRDFVHRYASRATIFQKRG
ncbi:NUDIX hydrolase [Marivita hallyeonensis]|uniref:8-oxo-dGTP diphosphatase n=1 Tax=Marivita hallyeonensis TaxID=996342 RepID=A0A1M5UC86_9RHOB|nr:NUDIX hydrolase [Marivita hallyeonensis]SHH60577.1 8-oxo-dGTP diphosphatase [Marivita hallyeonensis]